jgi:mannose-1-phosphate guanylyltransferase
MQALILAGGSGTRFWPLSRKSRPKQLLALEGERTLLRDTVERLRPLVPPEAVWICTTRALADAVRRELPEVPPEQILLEPVGRNTAPAIGWSIRSMPEAVRHGAVAVLPADHRVGDPAAFRDALARAARAVEAEDRVMTL